MNIVRRTIAKLVYPDGLRCILCGGELDGEYPDGYCRACSPKRVAHCCEICGTTLFDPYRNYCDRCLYGYDKLYFDGARAPFPYADEHVKNIVWQIKYGGKNYLAGYMAVPMAEAVRAAGWQPDIITYVPLHKKRFNERGYNQAELLARSLGEIIDVPVIGTLEKLTYSRTTATGMGKQDREEMLRGSFALTGADIKNKTVLLTDDVLTSRATANECAKMLRLGKAKRVYVITYATSRGDKVL